MPVMPDAIQTTVIRKTINPDMWAKNALRDLQQSEKRTRIQIDSKANPVMVFRGNVTVNFDDGVSSGGAMQVPIPVNFGEIRFLEEPDPFFGWSIILPEGTPRRVTLDDAMRLFNPDTDGIYPCGAGHYWSQQDANGIYVGALIVAYVLGTPPSGFKAKIHYEYVGKGIKY
jgi:hypothetical protein